MPTLSLLRRAAAILPLAVFLIVVASASSVLTSCKSKEPVQPGDSTTNAKTPKEKVLDFVVARCGECDRDLVALELVVEPIGGSQDTNVARQDWVLARRQYEMARFLPEFYTPQYHNYVAAWISLTPGSGFHFLEMHMYIPSPDMKGLEVQVENSAAVIRSTIPNGLTNIGISDNGIFHGLQMMLNDIDTIKLSGADNNYSKNSFNDITSNLDGIDTVYSYYRDLVVKAAPATDTLFRGQMASTRAVLATAGSMANLNKAIFRNNTLPALQGALRQVAAALNVTLP